MADKNIELLSLISQWYSKFLLIEGYVLSILIISIFDSFGCRYVYGNLVFGADIWLWSTK